MPGTTTRLCFRRSASLRRTQRSVKFLRSYEAANKIRALVLWRKRSLGSQSERGNVFAERLMSVAHTARKRSVAVLAFLAACCEAHRDETDAPSLFDRDFAAAA